MKSARFARLAAESGVLKQTPKARVVADVFDAAFDVLKQGGLRDEYIYKAALTHRILLGKHNLKTACMLTEFRAGECKADVSILNGTTTAFEIKSERDSLSRLQRQIENYKRVFASVVVIVGENHVSSVLRATSKDVGVLSLSRRYQISTEREPIVCPARICSATVFDSLRMAEAKLIIKSAGQTIPDLPNTQMHAALRAVFTLLEPQIVHDGMLAALKKTRSLLPLAKLVDQLPRSLQPAALWVPMRRSNHDKLVAAVQTPLRQAMGWA
jgi:hypothetical protein